MKIYWVQTHMGVASIVEQRLSWALQGIVNDLVFETVPDAYLRPYQFHLVDKKYGSREVLVFTSETPHPLPYPMKGLTP